MGEATCGKHVCFAMKRREELEDKVIATFPYDCDAFLKGDDSATLAQWDQDTFVLQHFFRHLPRHLTYVDVGAFHPLSSRILPFLKSVYTGTEYAWNRIQQYAAPFSSIGLDVP